MALDKKVTANAVKCTYVTERTKNIQNNDFVEYCSAPKTMDGTTFDNRDLIAHEMASEVRNTSRSDAPYHPKSPTTRLDKPILKWRLGSGNRV